MSGSLSILLVGCGNMGGAMLARWREKLSDSISDFLVISPSNPAGYKENIGTKLCWYDNVEGLPASVSPDIILFAVKPQSLAEILPIYKNHFGEKPLYISIAAGKTIAFFAEHLGAEAKIIRAMPNTPALVGKAMTALCASANVTSAEREIATKLMEAIGSAIWIEEKYMDGVTAISGSGPAYVFLFLETLANAGISVGLDAEVAKKLALATLHGSVHLAEKSGETFEKLRQNVTSKGGTTEAALNVLMHENALKNLLQEAVQAAVKRAGELV